MKVTFNNQLDSSQVLVHLLLVGCLVGYMSLHLPMRGILAVLSISTQPLSDCPISKIRHFPFFPLPTAQLLFVLYSTCTTTISTCTIVPVLIHVRQHQPFSESFMSPYWRLEPYCSYRDAVLPASCCRLRGLTYPHFRPFE